MSKGYQGNGGNGNTGPWWAKLLVGGAAPTVLLAGILGMIPGIKSPLFEIRESMAAHRIETRRLVDVFSLTCQGTWRGFPDRQSDCEKAARGILRDQLEEPK